MASTFMIYYIETNLICWLFIGFVFYTYRRESRGLSESKWFLSVLVTVQVYCVSDILAALFRNQTVPGARAVLWISNAIYVTIPLILIVFWNQYIVEHVRDYFKPGKLIRSLDRLMPITAVILCVFAYSTPLTHCIFYLDELNSYHRTAGAYIIPAFAYVFMVYETVKLQFISRNSDSLEVKHDANLLSVFAIPCILFSMIQVLIYGTTISQVGFTMAVLMVYLGRQRNKISRDELTGLNNRREYEYAIDRMSKGNGTVMILMADVDDFKSINDRFGHQEGDNALKAVALILRRACANRMDLGSIALYRYGGDEFIMLSTEPNIENTKDILVSAIDSETEKWNSTSNKPYKLRLSLGVSCGFYSGKELHGIVESADKSMYAVKATRKR